MVRPRIGLPAEESSPPASPPQSAVTSLLGVCIDTLVRAATRVARVLQPAALTCLVASGCGPGQRVDVGGVVRDGRTGAPIANATVETAAGDSAQTDEDGRFTVPVEEGAEREITASADGRCPATERVDVSRAPAPNVTLHLFERLELPQEIVQVGFDSVVRVEVRMRCEADSPIEWEQIGGPPLDERLGTEDRGRVLVVHTHSLTELVRLDDRVGVIALDRRERGEYRFRMTATFGEDTETREVRVVAAPMATGLFQVATGADVYLNGGIGDSHDWEMTARPDHSEAELSGADQRVASFRPDRFGTYTLEHRGTGVQMLLQAGAYEDVPRDCGRDGCHAAEADGWTETAHARTFERGIRGDLGPEFGERCWSCHATGVDHGIENGGLHHTAESVGWQQPTPDASVWDAMPRQVRRHGSVWCSACHGPGRIIPPQFRWQYGAKYQAGVCARCHDVDEDDGAANHRSPHVDEWRLSPMSDFVRDLAPTDPALRSGCNQCHSAQGFVTWQTHGSVSGVERETVEPVTCPTCHDPHDASNPRGLRVYDTSPPIAGAPATDMGAGALCATCHRPGVANGEAADMAPHAAQAGLLVGRGSRTTADVTDGAHQRIADTCARCHMTRPDPSAPEYGAVGGHTFSVRAQRGDPELSLAACSPCHGEVEPEAIGARDYDGDGEAGPIGQEHDRALGEVSERLQAHISAASISDACSPARTAADVVDLDARLHLVDATGQVLGDCDGDGRIGEGEQARTVTALPGDLVDAAWDVAMLRADGSRGAHNPQYTFAILATLAQRLQ